MFVKQFAMAALFGCAAILSAAAITNFQSSSNGTFSGKDGIFTVTGKGIVSAASGKETVIDPAKKYRISGEFRIAPSSAKKSDAVYFAYAPMTAAGKAITPHSCNTKKELTTELLKDVKPSDKVIFVKDGSLWGDSRGIRLGFIAFRAKKDMSDLPNFNYSYNGRPAKVEKTAEGWKVTLRGTIGVTGKKGETVRLHYDGSSFPYMTGTGLNQNWKTLAYTVTGMGTDAGNSNRFWPGTKKIGVVIFKAGTADFQFRNVKIEEIK